VTIPSQATLTQALLTYQDWLAHQPLSAHTRRTYLGRVRQYCAYLVLNDIQSVVWGSRVRFQFRYLSSLTHPSLAACLCCLHSCLFVHGKGIEPYNSSASLDQ
jgi:hypothetical protein